MYHENEYHVAVKNNSPVFVGYTRIWTGETKQRYVTDITLKDTEYEAYKVIEDQIGYVDTLALTAIENASYDLINLVDAVSNGLYNPQDPNTELSVQTTNQEGV